MKYPNALIFGILFLGITGYGIFDLLLHATKYAATQIIVQIIFITFPLIIESMSLSFNTIKVNLLTHKIMITTQYCLVFPSIETYNLSDIKKIKIKQFKANYSAGGGMLATAQNTYSVKETNMYFYTTTEKPYFTLERLSTTNTSELIDFFTNELNIELI